MLILVASAACGGKGGGSDDDDDGTGTASLTIAPADATIALTRTATGYTASQAFTVTAKAADGSTRDVTGDVTWSVDDASILAFDATGTATLHAAGPYPVTAFYADQVAHATLTATLADTGLAAGFPDGSQGKLDGAPTATTAPTIVYPLAGALFPINLPAIEIHLQKSDPSQALARIALSDGALLDYKFYAPCTASPNPGKFPNACIVSLDKSFAAQLAGVSEANDLQLTARLAAADGTQLGESQPIALAWSKAALSGGLYYWTTGAGGGDDTQIARYNFDTADQPPEVFLSNTLAPKVPQGNQCIGCHALSPDGAKMSFSMGGSLPGYYSLFDVATTTAIKTDFSDRFADMATFSPDGERVVTMSYGNLTLRTADSTLGVITDHVFATQVTEKLSHPFWSPGGAHFAFVSWNPSAADMMAGQVTGDMVQGGQIWIADSDGKAMTSAPRLIVPRADNVTSFYPAISDDDQLVVFNRSRCDGPANTSGWGAGACDGYNDISATLNLVSTRGGAVVPLTRANGGDDPKTTNSWPRWSPDHGTFRGKRLYWVAFSSRRSYGLALAGSQTDTTKPQLWFAAVAVAADGSTPAPGDDPSFAPVWLPGQNPVVATPRGNHTPVWTSKVVILQ